MRNIFQVNANNPYSPRSHKELYCRNPKAVKYETETYVAPNIWSLVPEIISSKTLNVFKNKIRKWKPSCPCRLCKTYLQHVGFI